jgi:SPX domain protein involved in polyphosphate accumulation
MVFSELDKDQVRSIILGHSNLFSKVFPPRQVNNIYFDTHDQQLRNDHIQGSLTRSKIRFRWYQPTSKIENGQLEIKTKQSNLGRKTTYPLKSSIDLEAGSWKDIQLSIADQLSEQIKSSFLQTWPILINHYQREYYQNADQNIRITLDYGLRSFDQAFATKPNLIIQSPMLNLSVLEIKANAEEFRQVSEVLDEFPHYAQAFSKYLQGTEASGI